MCFHSLAYSLSADCLRHPIQMAGVAHSSCYSTSNVKPELLTSNVVDGHSHQSQLSHYSCLLQSCCHWFKFKSTHLEINSGTPPLRTSEMQTCCLNGHFVHDQVWIALLLIAVCYNPRNGNTLLFHSAQVLVPELYKNNVDPLKQHYLPLLLNSAS